MSQENVDAVRLSIQAYLRGDWAAATAYLDRDVLWESGQEMPAKGPAAVRQTWERWTADWAELDMVDEEFVDAGDRVVVAMHYRGRGRFSGAVVELREFEVHTFRNGRCVHEVNFKTRAEALAAAGLSE